jgi:PIN domain nuclease of toxin-antitoxin system
MGSTNTSLVLDTHVWIWLLAGSEELSTGCRGRIEEAARSQQVLVSAVSAWEVGMLEAKRRVRLGKDCLEWVLEALSRPGIHLAPLSPEIAVGSTRLPGSFVGDPADRIIVATARTHGAILVTRDGAMLDYAAGGHVTALPA